MSIDINNISEDVKKTLEQLENLKKHIEELQNKIQEEFRRNMDLLKISNIDEELLKDFFEEPYVLIPKRKDEYYVITPRWLKFQVGWLERQTKGYNIWVINKYIRWITDIPKAIEEKLRVEEQPPLKVIDGMLWTGKHYQNEAWKRYRKFLSRREGRDKIKIRKGYEFKLIAKLIEDGILPFIPQPVDENDIRQWSGISLRNYQRRAWREFLNKGAIGIFWAFGSGKSLFGLYALARIKGRKLVVVPTVSLREQWISRIQEYIPEYMHEIDVITYYSAHKVLTNEYTLTIYDEVHHLPANSFVKLATIKTKYRIGLSASPWREDGRENYIIALTGYPIGMDWQELIKQGIVKEPIFKVYILKDQRHKMKKLEELLRIPVKTIIFCDYIDLGKKISKKFNIPFVYGETRERMKIIQESDVCVVSRVGDEGLSLPNIERVIEVAFLYGSRQQESQRFGRLMHSLKEEPEHIILMTEKELQAYEKRLYAITERGFRIHFIR